MDSGESDARGMRMRKVMMVGRKENGEGRMGNWKVKVGNRRDSGIKMVD